MKYIAFALALAASGCQGVSQPATAGGVLPSAVASTRQHPLLYVGSAGGSIDAFTYPRGKLAGQITTNYGSDGMCSDKEGNIFVAVPNGYEVVVFPHGGVFPIYVLSEASNGVLPDACASDRTSGDLAVTNFEGGVEMYKNGRGKPQAIAMGLDEAFFATFDDKGNLFVTGERAGGFRLAELPAGSAYAKSISVDASVATGYGIASNGRDLVLQSADASGTATMLTVKVSGSSATVIRTTTLMGAGNYFPAQFVLDGRTIVEPNASNTGVGFWSYPSGGAPTKTLQNVGSALIGVTVSR